MDRDRLAHALTPWEWRGRNLAIGIVALVVVAAVTCVQRFLQADGGAGYVWAGAHTAVAVVVVVLLARRAVSRWRAIQTRAGVPS